jgi:rhomboid family GlyGly-CTERM serine protease
VQPKLTPAIAAAVAILALAWLPEQGAAQLAYVTQSIFSGEMWRLWTAHFVHFSLQHAASDALALCLTAMLAERLAGQRTVWIALAACPPLISLGLIVAVPGLEEYRGASGLVVMMAALCAVKLWETSSGAGRIMIAALGSGFVAKTLADATGHGFSLTGLPGGVVVAWQAHILGAICAIAFAVVERERA